MELLWEFFLNYKILYRRSFKTLWQILGEMVLALFLCPKILKIGFLQKLLMFYQGKWHKLGIRKEKGGYYECH